MEKIASFTVQTRYLQWKMMTNDDCKESFFFGYHIFRQNEMKWDHLKWDHCAGSIDSLSSFFSSSLTFFFSMCLKGL